MKAEGGSKSAARPTAAALRTFLAKFDQLADVPEAVENLRCLILELAVHGTLAEQNEMDGDASRIFENQVGRKDGQQQIEAEGRFPVPVSWKWIHFAAVGDQRLGKMLDQKGNRGAPKPYLRNTNVQWMRFDLDDIKVSVRQSAPQVSAHTGTQAGQTPPDEQARNRVWCRRVDEPG